MSLLGVNLSGAEFGWVGGAYGTAYTYPTHAEVDYYAAKGLNVIRLPFLWERLQPTLDGSLDPTELARLDDIVSYATSKGLKVILDPHDFGAYNNSLIGSGTPNSAFADFWSKLAAHFESNANVMFGLMNEPNQQSASSWLQSENAAIAAIRATGASQEILVDGTYWDGAWSWTTTDNASVIGTGIVDPGHNFAFEVHQYLDGDSSGKSAGVVSATIGVERLTAITQWAEAHGARLFLGEFGVAGDQTSLTAMSNMLAYMDQHTDVWQGATYWAGGPWLGSYMFSIEPQNGVDAPQMQVLEQFVPAASSPGAPTITLSAIAGDGVLSAAEAQSGLTVAGTSTGAVGRTVTVSFHGAQYFTNVRNDGSWSVAVPASAVAAGALPDGSYSVRADVTNAAGVAAPEALTTLVVHETLPVLGQVAAALAYASSGPVAIAPNLTVSDAGAASLSSALVSIQGLQSGDTLQAQTAGTNIQAAYAAGSLQLSGTDTLARYQQVLRLVTYQFVASGTGPSPARDVTWSVFDGTNASSPAFTTISLSGGPVVTHTAPSSDLGVGQTITVTVTTGTSNLAVTGTPKLSLNDGGAASYVAGLSHPATGVLVFQHTVAAGDATPSGQDLQVTGLAALAGASIVDGSGHALDLSGVTGADLGVTVDGIAPTVMQRIVTTSNGPAILGAGRTVTIELDMSEAMTVRSGSGVPALTLDNGGFSARYDAAATAALGDRHKLAFTLTVAAGQSAADLTVTGASLAGLVTDLAGNAAGLALTAAEADLHLAVDGVAPTVSKPVLSPGPGGGRTAKPAQTVSGTVGAAGRIGREDVGTIVSIYDGATLLGTATVAANGAWSKAITLAGDGTHTLVAKDTDAAGNVGTSAATTIVLDTTAPTVAIVSPAGGLTNKPAQTIRGSVDPADAGTNVTVLDGGKALGSAKVLAGGAWSMAVTLAGNGTHTLVARDTDAAGNTGSSAPVVLTLDTAAPVVRITAAAAITNDTTPTIGGTVDLADIGTLVTIVEGSIVRGTATVGANGAWTSTNVTLAANGKHTLVARDSDAAGNIGVSPAVVVTVDTIAPVVAIKTAGGLTRARTLTIAGTVDVADAGTTVKLYDNGAGLAGATAKVAANGTWSAVATLTGDGSHVLVAKDTDAAGNTGASGAVGFTLDATPPVVRITAPGAGPTNLAAQTITGTVADAHPGAKVTIFDGAKALGTATVVGGAWSAHVVLAGNGTHVLTAKDTDAAGNIGTSNAVAVTLDTIAPTVTKVTASPAAGDVLGGQTVTITLTLSEAAIVSGAPVLRLSDGGSATYVGGSGSRSLVFRYTAGGESTTDLRVTKLDQSTGTIKDLVGNQQSSTLASDLKLQVNVFTFTATTGGGGDWNTAAHWAPSTRAPGTGDTAQITKAGTYIVTSNQGNTVFALATAAGATLAIGNGSTFQTTGGTGAGVSAGTIVVRAGATLVLGGRFANTGMLFANGGRLVVDGTLAGGTTTIGGAGTVEIAAASNAEAISFAAGATGRLVLDHSTGFSGKIAGFGANHDVVESIDLADISLAGVRANTAANLTYTPTTAANTSGMLTIKDGTHTAQLHFTGTYTKASFKLVDDGAGHVKLTDPPIAPAPALDGASSFAGAASSFGALDCTDIGLGAGTTLGYAPGGDGSGAALTVTQSAGSTIVMLLGGYIASSFADARDGYGTLVIDPSAPHIEQLAVARS